MPVNYLKSFLKNDFYRSVLTLFTGSFIAQIIPFAITPILTRLYPAEAFGIYVLYTSTAAIPQILATLQYELAIVLPKRDVESANILVLSLFITVCISIIILILILIFKNMLAHLFHLQQLGIWLYFIPLSVFLQGLFQSFSYWNIRKKEYKVISINRVNKSGSSSVIQLLLGFLKLKDLGLITGMLFGQIIQSCFYAVTIFRKYKYIIKHVTLNRMYYVFKKFKDIPLLNTIIDLLNTLSNQLPVYLLNMFYGIATTGFYGLAYKISATPMEIIRISFKQVFFQNATEIFNNKKDLYGFVVKTYKRLFKISVIPFIILFIISPYIYKYIFGASWDISGKYAQIIIPWIFIVFLNSPLANLITILNIQRSYLIYESILLVFRFAALYIGYKVFHNVFYSLFLFTLVGFIFNLFLTFYFLHNAKLSSKT